MEKSKYGLLDALQPIAHELRGIVTVESINGIENIPFEPITIYNDFLSQQDIENEISTLEFDGYRILQAKVDVYCIMFNNQKDYLHTKTIKIN